MVSQHDSGRSLKISIEDELMTKGDNLFHGSTIRTEKPLFYEPDEKEDDTISGRDHEDENKSKE